MCLSDTGSTAWMHCYNDLRITIARPETTGFCWYTRFWPLKYKIKSSCLSIWFVGICVACMVKMSILLLCIQKCINYLFAISVSPWTCKVTILKEVNCGILKSDIFKSLKLFFLCLIGPYILWCVCVCVYMCLSFRVLGFGANGKGQTLNRARGACWSKDIVQVTYLRFRGLIPLGASRRGTLFFCMYVSSY